MKIIKSILIAIFVSALNLSCFSVESKPDNDSVSKLDYKLNFEKEIDEYEFIKKINSWFKQRSYESVLMLSTDSRSQQRAPFGFKKKFDDNISEFSVSPTSTFTGKLYISFSYKTDNAIVKKEIEKIMGGVILRVMITSTIAKADILSLSVSERIQLAEDIWDSVVEVPQSVPLTEAEKVELDSRLDAYHQNPDAGSPWIIVKERIRSRR